METVQFRKNRNSSICIASMCIVPDMVCSIKRDSKGCKTHAKLNVPDICLYKTICSLVGAIREKILSCNTNPSAPSSPQLCIKLK